MSEQKHPGHDEISDEGAKQPYVRPVPFGDLPNAVDNPDDAADQFIWPPDEEKLAMDAKRLLGLDRTYNKFTHETMGRYLSSNNQQRAFENLDTSTHPRKAKIEQKRGVIAEILQGNLLSKDILRNYPTVYLGSGTDIEYPLTLGSRSIVMVDYILENHDTIEEIIRRIEAITNEKLMLNGSELHFSFDFGEGPEPVVVILEASAFNLDTHGATEPIHSYEPPNRIGFILGYAAQGPSGPIKITDSIKSKLVHGGAIINDDKIIRVDPDTGSEEMTQLGSVSARE